ncbi:MAG: hypothetical protein D6722_00710 [Bacteroidetes bacterium]|nr:MAG: hypothetical protein D6722_00710 [Bacteroidota bacterium]
MYTSSHSSRFLPGTNRLGLFLVLFCLPMILAAQGYHHVIAGSFDNQAAATRFHDALRLKGENPFIIFPRAGETYYRVAVYSGTDKAAAQAFAQKARQKGHKYWVLTMADPMSTGPALETARTSQPASAGAGVSRGDGPYYHLIAASFQSLESAASAMQSLRQDGFEPYVIMPRTPGGMYRVSVYRADAEREAKTYSKMLKRRGKNPGWVYEEEPGTVTTHGIGLAPTRRMGGTAITYHLIAGSVKTFTQAQAVADKLKAKGHDPLIMFPETGISETYRVSAYRATDRKQVKSYQTQHKLEGWIFELK